MTFTSYNQKPRESDSSLVPLHSPPNRPALRKDAKLPASASSLLLQILLIILRPPPLQRDSPLQDVLSASLPLIVGKNSVWPPNTLGGGLFFFFFFFFVFLGPHPWHMGGSRLGVELELQLPAYTTATATPDPSLHHSSQQHWILDPMSKARD